MNSVVLNAKTVNFLKAGGIDSSQLQALADSQNADLAKIAYLINTYLVPMVNSLADDADPVIDGNHIYVDNLASAIVDDGIFYDGRPITIREAFILIMQLIARSGLSGGTSYASASEFHTVTAGDVSNGYFTLDGNDITMDTHTKFQIYRSVDGINYFRMLSRTDSEANDTNQKVLVTIGSPVQISAINSHTLIAGDIYIIDYQHSEIILS